MREGARAQLYSMTHNSSLLFSSFSHGAIGPMEQQQQRVFQHRQTDTDTDSSAPFQEPLCHMGRARRQTNRHTVCFCQCDSVQSLAVRASLPEDSSFFFASHQKRVSVSRRLVVGSVETHHSASTSAFLFFHRVVFQSCFSVVYSLSFAFSFSSLHWGARLAFSGSTAITTTTAAGRYFMCLLLLLCCC